MNIKNIIISALSVVVIALAMMNSCNREQLNSANNLIEYKNDSLQMSKDKWGRLVAEKQSLVVTNNKQLRQLAKANVELQELAEELKKEKNKVRSAAIVEVVTTETIVGPTEIIDSCLYKIDTTNNWFSIRGIVGRDSFQISPTFRDRYTILHTEEKRLFKPNVITFKFKNENPHTEVRSVQSYTTKCNCNRGRYFLLGVGGGVVGVTGLRWMLR